MSKTAYQKIIDSHIKKTLNDGRHVLALDWVWGHEITTPNAILDAKSRDVDVVFNPNKIKTMIDHVNPAKDTASAIQGKIVREWSNEHGVEFMDVGNNGVCHAIIPEAGWIAPGHVGIMGDSHTCTHGAFCAFTAGVGTTDLESGIITGLWIVPPQKVMRVNFNGKLPSNVFAKDLILTLINKIGVKGATNSVIEFGGEVIEKMSMEARMTITNMAVEAGGTSGMCMVDATTVDYLWEIIKDDYQTKEEALEKLSEWNSDDGCVYDQVIDIDVNEIKPVMTINYTPEEVVSVQEKEGTKVDQVYIGSCTNGRIEDLRIAAKIIKGKKVADGVRCVVVPATQRIYTQAVQEGLVEIFANAGCFVGGPSCGACLGMSCGVIAPGEVCVSTTNRNFRGRMGKDGMVHLASPATAAFTAISGKIKSPEKDFDYTIKEHDTKAEPTGWQEKEFTKVDYKKLAENQIQLTQDFGGKVFYLDFDNVDTDQLMPARYLNEVEKKKFGEYCLEDAPINDEDRPRVKESQIIVTGENFGCGSSREHAVWTLDESGIRAVIAPSFARIFYNNMYNNGMLAIELGKDEIEKIKIVKPGSLEIDIEKGEIKFGNNIVKFEISDYQKELIRNKGSIGVMLKMAAEISG